ncbi:hypothetical protein KQI84_09520 [bacterium]|nr:hypothetical protein [bacterium]
MSLRRTATFAFLLLLVLGSVGCSIIDDDKIFADFPAPGPGEMINSELWDQVEGTDSVHRSSHAKTWPLPWFFSLHDFAISREAASRFDFAWYDLGNPLIFLPVYVSAGQAFYEAGDHEPIGEAHLFWTPFWTSAKTRNPQALGSNLNAWGVPLFVSHVGGNLRNGDFSLTNILWTLGPMVMSYETKSGNGGYVATPFLLGGLLGSILWADFDIREDQNRIIGHGPLFSYLGYSDVTSQYRHKVKKQRMVILGILWFDRSLSDLKKNQVINSSHGPLWGMFGWGRKNTAPTVRFLWIPIRVGSGAAEEGQRQ